VIQSRNCASVLAIAKQRVTPSLCAIYQIIKLNFQYWVKSHSFLTFIGHHAISSTQLHLNNYLVSPSSHSLTGKYWATYQPLVYHLTPHSHAKEIKGEDGTIRSQKVTQVQKGNYTSGFLIIGLFNQTIGSTVHCPFQGTFCSFFLSSPTDSACRSWGPVTLQAHLTSHWSLVSLSYCLSLVTCITFLLPLTGHLCHFPTASLISLLLQNRILFRMSALYSSPSSSWFSVVSYPHPLHLTILPMCGSFHLLLASGLTLWLSDRWIMFLQNIDKPLPDYTVSQPRNTTLQYHFCCTHFCEVVLNMGFIYVKTFNISIIFTVNTTNPQDICNLCNGNHSKYGTTVIPY
jgi:hypothetical protein